jgi:hypothetical protein
VKEGPGESSRLWSSERNWAENEFERMTLGKIAAWKGVGTRLFQSEGSKHESGHPRCTQSHRVGFKVLGSRIVLEFSEEVSFLGQVRPLGNPGYTDGQRIENTAPRSAAHRLGL